MTVLELRATWFLLGLLLVFVLSNEPRFVWHLVAGLPWLIGCGLLLPARTAAAIANVSKRLLADRGVRVALLVLGILAVAVAQIFTVAGALTIVTSCLVLAGILAAVGRFTVLRTMIVGVTASSVTIALTLLVLELVLRTEGISTRLGFPSEIIAWEDRYDRLWEENVHRFRSHHEDVRKRSGVFRVLALGDSFTWGDKIADSDSTWPAILEERLALEVGAGRVEVISMAQRGYTTANEAELLQRLGWEFDPDMVVIQFFANDALPSFPNFRRVGGEWLCPQHGLVPVRFRTSLVQSSAVVALMERQYNALRSPEPCYLQFDRLYEESSSTWGEFQAAVGLIADSARSRHTPVLFVLFPFLAPGEWTADSHPLQPVHERVASVAEKEGFSLLDLAAHFATAGGDWQRWWATAYDSHPNGAAQQLVAAAIARSILENEILARPPQNHPGKP
jgi:lysophospholipase L1-like esterase